MSRCRSGAEVQVRRWLGTRLQLQCWWCRAGAEVQILWRCRGEEVLGGC